MKPMVVVSSADADFYLLLSHILEADGYVIALASGMEQTVAVAGESAPHAVILDCRAGCRAAVEICAALKQDEKTRNVFVVALISQGAEKLYADLLNAGIDESFFRPVAPARFLDYLRQRLEGAPVGDPGPESFLAYADIEMNLATRRVRRNGADVHLGPIEFKLLRHLLQNPEQVFSRDELISAAWPDNVFVEPRTVDVHIGRLRKSLTRDGGNIIRTVRAAGYAIDQQLI